MNRCFAAAVVLALGCSKPPPPATLGNDFDAALPPEDLVAPAPDVSDVEVYQPPDAVPVRPVDAYCGGESVSLAHRNANVILVVDRSGSMGDPTTDGMVKWVALREALQTVLPSLSADISVGLTFFPAVLPPPADGGIYTPAMICTVPTALALEPRPTQSALILERFAQTMPGGPTPTAASLRLVRDWYRSAPDLTGDRYVILATDGGPNCNLMADPTTCRCTGGPGLCVPTNPYAQINCLDQGPAITELQNLARDDVHTFVIGLNGTQSFADVLNLMADAGGRGRPGSTARYYSAATAIEITRQLEGITEVLSDCTLRLMRPPPDPTLVDVRLDGRSLIHDLRRNDGWDWGDDGHNQIVFYGRTCTDVRLASGGSRLVAAFGCPAPVPP